MFTNPQAQPPVPVQSLSKMIGQVAVIAVIQGSVLGTDRLDREASEVSDKAHAAKIGTAKTIVNRLPGSEKKIRSIKSWVRKARDLLKSYTTAWGEDRRLMPNVNLQDFLAEYADIEKAYNAEVAAFIKDASLFISQAKSNLGKYKVAPPSLDEIKNGFSMKFDITPVPNVMAFSTGDKAFEAQMKEKFEADVVSAYEAATKDALKKLAQPLKNLVERMAAYDQREKAKAKGEEVGKEGTFKTTIIENIHDVAKVFRSFNLVNDPFLEQIATELDGFDYIESDDLKKHKAIRADASIRAKEILKTLEGVI